MVCGVDLSWRPRTVTESLRLPAKAECTAGCPSLQSSAPGQPELPDVCASPAIPNRASLAPDAPTHLAAGRFCTCS